VPLARGTCDAAEHSGKPVVASFLPGQIVTDGVAYLQEHGIPNFSTGERAVAALARMADYKVRKASRQMEKQKPGFCRCAYRKTRFLPSDEQLLEPEAMAWLRENDIPVLDFRFAATQSETIQSCREIGYPVVMKVVSPDILHKSDYGGVILDIQNKEAALAAFETLQRTAISNHKDFRGAVIYPMIRGAQEVLLGLSRDPQFGPVVAFGLGGVYTEIWRDISLRVAPVDRVEAESMIREIKSFRLLQGVRGQEPCDLDALADVLVNFSRLPFRYPEIDEVDLNPVFLFPEGLVVGDVRVIHEKRSKHQ
jgi:acetyltransferase